MGEGVDVECKHKWPRGVVHFCQFNVDVQSLPVVVFFLYRNEVVKLSWIIFIFKQVLVVMLANVSLFVL